MRLNYRYHIRQFLKFCNNEPPSVEDVRKYRMFLIEKYGGKSTMAIKWAACKNYLKNDSGWSTKTLVKEIAWIEYCHPFPKRIMNMTERVTNSEFSKIYHLCSEREKLFMDLIRRMDLKVQQLCDLKVDSLHVPEDLRIRCREVFNGEYWLCETSNGTPYNRTYISNRIAHHAARAIGRAVRAEAIRPQIRLAGGVDLDRNGRIA